MARKLTPTWPFRMRGLYIVLGLSLLINVVVLSFMVYFNSRQADQAMMKTAIAHICTRDYDWYKAGLPTEGSQALFSEGLCNRDVNTGSTLSGDHSKIVNGHYVFNAN
ncbi:hypothetical protein HJC99_03505 [Candidatus Saccharibacteria bacterium]|nr:hypothetical protein [Candidatus Saccharibacteria bacterium]